MYAPELAAGTVIADRYTLQEYKGSGSFGEVWLARDNELGIDVAIKLYISLDQKGQTEFKEEYRVAYGLSHENLLTAQYYSVWDHRPFLVMKYCSQGSAGTLAGKISETDIWRFIHDVANGLKYLHSQEPPIIHQDIKPENILVDEQGAFLITDFGISKKMRTTMRKQSKRNIASGAIAYMGPERFLGSPLMVMASDIWSLGVSIYELATGDLPFMGQGGGMLNAGAALPALGPGWSENLNILMQACLAKETWDRPTAEDLTDYTRDVLKGSTLSWPQWKANGGMPPESSGTLPAGSPSGSRSSLWVIAGIAAAAVVAAVLAGVYFFGQKAEDESRRQAAIEERYNHMLAMCENDIRVGNASNYQSLLAARPLLDSLKTYRQDYPFICSADTGNEVEDLEQTLQRKSAEAAGAWERAAKGQRDIAEDLSTAISYYHIAARLNPTKQVEEALRSIGRTSDCKGVYMAVTSAEYDGGQLRLQYDGLCSESISDVRIIYELGNDDAATPIARGQATVTIEPGKSNTIRIAVEGDYSGASINRLTLLNNNTAFYSSNLTD